MNQDNQDERQVQTDSHGGPRMVEVGDKPEALLFDQFPNSEVQVEKKLMDLSKEENEAKADGFETRVLECLQEKEKLMEKIRMIMAEARNQKPRHEASKKKYWKLVL
jgi:hypothetical protein